KDRPQNRLKMKRQALNCAVHIPCGYITNDRGFLSFRETLHGGFTQPRSYTLASMGANYIKRTKRRWSSILQARECDCSDYLAFTFGHEEFVGIIQAVLIQQHGITATPIYRLLKIDEKADDFFAC